MASRMTAPTNATMINATVLVMAIPTSPASQPPRNAPRMPTTMSQMSPSPCPVMTFPARKPAIAPTMMKTIRFISDETSSLPRSHHLTAPVARQTAQGTFPPEKKALDAAAQRDVLLRHRAPSSQEMEPPSNPGRFSDFWTRVRRVRDREAPVRIPRPRPFRPYQSSAET